MKGIDIFCASQSATAIRHSMDHPSSSTTPSATILLSGGSSSPAIDRCNPIITDAARRSTKLQLPPPLVPKQRKKKKNQRTQRHENSKNIDNDNGKEVGGNVVRKSWSCTKPGDFISPPGSTRYLLSEKVLSVNSLPEFGEGNADVKKIEPVDAKPVSPDQVVVLRVSLHCRGCEKKMRKHISRMEGVRSFNIDFAAQKVTVTGNVTALGVLSSISKVKNAQLWSPSIASSTPPPLNHEFKGPAEAWAMHDKGTFVGISSS